MSVSSIETLYVGYFGRAADPAGLNYWLTEEAAGISDTVIAQQFAPQPETLGLYPGLATPLLLQSNPTLQATYINQVYANLFGHPADAAGLAFWQAQITANGNAGIIIAQIISGAQGTDLTTMQNKAAVATTYTNAVVNATNPPVAWSKNDVTSSHAILATVTSTAASVSATGPSIMAAIAADQSGNNGTAGVTLTLTGGPDNFSPTSTTGQTTAGNDLIRGVGPAGGIGPGFSDLATADSINGGGGFNTLSSILAAAAVVNPVLVNMQAVNLGLVIAAQTFNGSASTGIQTLTVSGGNIVPGGAPTEVPGTLTVSNIPLSVTAGMNNAKGFLDNLLVSFTGASGAAGNLLLTNNVGGSFEGDGLATYNIASGTLTATGANTVQLDAAGGTATEMTVNITGGAQLTLTTGANLGITTFNGSATTGNLSITTGALTAKSTISAGSGATDILDASLATKAVTMTAGSGTDNLLFNGAVAASSITAGTGVDTIQTQVAGGGMTFISAADTTNNTQLLSDVITVNSYVAGNTKIDLTGLAGAGYSLVNTAAPAVAAAAQLAASAQSTLLKAVNAVASTAGILGTKAVVAFNFSGNEYVYQDNVGAATLSAADGLMNVANAGATFKTSDLSLA